MYEIQLEFYWCRFRAYCEDNKWHRNNMLYAPAEWHKLNNLPNEEYRKIRVRYILETIGCLDSGLL